jgi:hypothetical protein
MSKTGKMRKTRKTEIKKDTKTEIQIDRKTSFENVGNSKILKKYKS